MHRAKKYCYDQRFEGNGKILYNEGLYLASMGHFCTYVLLSNGYTVQFGHLGHVFGLCHFCLINFKAPPDVRIPLGHLVKKAAKFKPLFGEMSERFFLVQFKIRLSTRKLSHF